MFDSNYALDDDAKLAVYLLIVRCYEKYCGSDDLPFQTREKLYQNISNIVQNFERHICLNMCSVDEKVMEDFALAKLHWFWPDEIK